MTIPRTPTDELAYRVQKALSVIERHLSIADAEPFLEEVLAEAVAHPEHRAEYEIVFEALALVLPRGARYILEFSFRTLRWLEFQSYIEALRSRTLDVSRRSAYERILAVYEPVWPDGDLYARYRTAEEGMGDVASEPDRA